MANQTPSSEAEIAKIIIQLRDVNQLSWRRISKELAAQNLNKGKDTCQRLYQKYRTQEMVSFKCDRELRQLQKRELRAQRRLQLIREKAQIQKRIKLIEIEEAMATYERRMKLFSDEEELTIFVVKVLAVNSPQLWDDFKEFCDENGYVIPDSVCLAVGEQIDFENQFTQEPNEKLGLPRNQHLIFFWKLN